MKQKYKSGDLLADNNGDIIEVIGHSLELHYYLCSFYMCANDMDWLEGKWVDKLEKIGTL